jgi:hypothetical protein
MKNIKKKDVDVLKENLTPFKDLLSYQKAILKFVGKEACLFFSPLLNKWKPTAEDDKTFYPHVLYRIKRSYQLPKTISKFHSGTPIRTFSSGATRDTDEGKLDFEGFFSPLALVEYAKYMHKHRLQPDGELRDSDNWQKGIPEKELVKSLIRHVMDVWLLYRDYKGVATQDKKEAICGVIFNAMALLHEQAKKQSNPP